MISPVMLVSLAGGLGLLAGLVVVVRWRLRHAADPLILRLIADAGAKAVPGMGRPDWQIIVDHLEVDDVKNVVVPLPKDQTLLESIGLPVIRGMEYQEAAYAELEKSWARLTEHVHEDKEDAEIAKRRLAEIKDRPETVIRGEELAKRLEALL